ncbi:MAG: hypothetical protein IR153_03515 [Flavobacterium sp.]|nr:hypothetical protein [Flavobacterium sp.]
MKNIALAVFAALIFVSCGDKKETQGAATGEVKIEKYAVVLEGIYEKDDSVKVFYQQGNHYNYEKPVTVKVDGSPLQQRIVIEMPENVQPENFTLTVSTNKEQNVVFLPNVSIMKGDQLLLDGKNFNYSKYFLSDQSFTWIPEGSKYQLNHKNQYPPSMVGNDELAIML